MTTAYDRWTGLVERDAVGEPLTAEERSFLEEYAATDPMAAAELELFGSFSSMHAAADEAGDQALADAAVRVALSDGERGPAPVPLRRSRWLLWGTASAAAAAAVLALLVRSHGPEPRAASPLALSVVEYVDGQVEVAGHRVQKGAHAAVGSEVAAIGAPACVAVEPRIHACLASGTRVRLTAVGPGGRRIDLLAGRVAVALDPLPPGERFSVVANGVWSTAVGTAFTVELLADGTVRTVVHEGKVAVGPEHSSDIVSGHKIGLSSAGAVRIVPPVEHSSLETPDWIALARVANRPIEGPTETVAAAPAPQAVAAAERPGSAAVRPRRVVPAPVRNAVPDTAATNDPAPPAATADSLLAAARQALRDQRWGDAAAKYREIIDSFPGTPEAHTVLVSLAKVELQQLGQPAAALRDLDSYLERGGPLSLEAKLTKIRAYRALGRSADEAAAIDELLAEHPNGLEVQSLRQRREALTH